MANQIHFQKRHSGSLAPLCGNLESVYSLYNFDAKALGPGESGGRVKRDLANPQYTNYCIDFKGTLDHMIYNKTHLEVLELLEMPSDELIMCEGALPSTLFPSDHMRIEAKFYIK